MSSVMMSPVSLIRGVGDSREKALLKLGIQTVGDLLYHFPRAYQNRGDVVTLRDAVDSGADAPHSFILTVACEPTVKMIRRGMTLVKFKAFDESASCEITYFNQTYLRDMFFTGAEIRFWGKAQKDGKTIKIYSPVCEPVGDVKLMDIVPVYPLASGLTQKFMSKCIAEALRLTSKERIDPIPGKILKKEGLCTLEYALKNVHFPESADAMHNALKRLCFEEMFTVSVAISMTKSKKQKSGAPNIQCENLNAFTSLLPYSLTSAQERSVHEILSDMNSSVPMNRILTGDVGSGKTVVCEIAAYAAVKSGYQVAVMAPTEILATQHYNDFRDIFKRLGIRVNLLTGSSMAAKKRDIIASLSGNSGERTDIVIGTHALLSDNVVFQRLGLVITDEQHRFGVMQRAALAEKSKSVHTLVMSATPIPRTLSLVIYGELAVSRLDEMPKGRQKVDTFVVNESYRARLDGFIKKQVSEGHQVYVICPTVEENTGSQIDESTETNAEEMSDMELSFNDSESKPPLKSAVNYAAELIEKLPELKIACVHGKMKAHEKEKTMSDFAAGKIDVLVSTTVIEVGVNVPNATLVIVENAERFGLSQLHQIRGRVGRGNAKSYCVLVSDSNSENAKRRLDVMRSSNDGYKIAEEDLLLRGPGDFLSSDGEFRQSGGIRLKLAGKCSDPSVLVSAVEDAHEIIANDPSLDDEDNYLMKERVEAMIGMSANTIN